MASISGRVDEANKLLECGHKSLKTGLLKWTADHDNAANQFNQAAMAFKGAGINKRAIEAYDLAIKSYMESNNQFQAAKCMEQAAMLCKESNDMQTVSSYYTRALDIYKTLGQLDTAISTMDKAAKTLAPSNPTLAADLYIQASEICVVEDRFRQAAEFCNRAAVLYVKAKDYRRAANMAREEINCYNQAGDTRTCSRTAMCIILIHLTDDEIVGAMDVLKTCQMDEETYGIAHKLVAGYDKKDTRLLNSTLSLSYFKNLDTEYSKMARDLLNLHGKIVEAPKGADGNDVVVQNDDDALL